MDTHQHYGVVGGRVHLCRDETADKVYCVVDDAVHLRTLHPQHEGDLGRAPQGVGVLHAVTEAMALGDLARIGLRVEERPEPPRHLQVHHHPLPTPYTAPGVTRALTVRTNKTSSLH